MAALHSYELKGNKQSFANWISNLSPTETPFSSMTSKEAVDQTRFFWQTDRLAMPKAHSVKEGSDIAEAEVSMNATTVLSNYTQILSRSLSVSDTANALANFGRGRELAYQMEKMSIALKRDLEVILLGDQAANAGNATTARKTAGFEALVATGADVETGADVQHETRAANIVALEDIREMTFNMFLANSEADVIMFHPAHAKDFAKFQTEGSNAKMFDGDSKTFSHYVNTYIDEFGKTYKLVPNRFMPANKVYFFKPSDFTQMVLRAPNKIQLGKEGNYEQWMIEMEVGLRLRDPWAAGVLTVKA